MARLGTDAPRVASHRGWLDPEDIAILARAVGSTSDPLDRDLERVLNKIYASATSLGKYRRFLSYLAPSEIPAGRKEAWTVAIAAAVECLRGQRPRGRASLANHIKYQMQRDLRELMQAYDYFESPRGQSVRAISADPARVEVMGVTGEWLDAPAADHGDAYAERLARAELDPEEEDVRFGETIPEAAPPSEPETARDARIREARTLARSPLRVTRPPLVPEILEPRSPAQIIADAAARDIKNASLRARGLHEDKPPGWLQDLERWAERLVRSAAWYTPSDVAPLRQQISALRAFLLDRPVPQRQPDQPLYTNDDWDGWDDQAEEAFEAALDRERAALAHRLALRNGPFVYVDDDGQQVGGEIFVGNLSPNVGPSTLADRPSPYQIALDRLGEVDRAVLEATSDGAPTDAVRKLATKLRVSVSAVYKRKAAAQRRYVALADAARQEVDEAELGAAA